MPINGIIESLSAPIEHVEPGMFFHFDGKKLSVYPHDPLDEVEIMDIFFNETQSIQSDSPKEDILIKGSIRPSAESAVFHVSQRPGIKDRGIYFGVVAYWIIENCFGLMRGIFLPNDKYYPNTCEGTVQTHIKRSTRSWRYTPSKSSSISYPMACCATRGNNRQWTRASSLEIHRTANGYPFAEQAAKTRCRQTKAYRPQLPPSDKPSCATSNKPRAQPPRNTIQARE